jgi:methylamine dehydrogenase accessory protein MauD
MEGWWLASYLALWVVVVVLAVLVVALARQVGTLHLRLGPRGALELDDEGPSLGDAPPPAELRDLRGRPVIVGGSGPARLLLFVSPGCPICREVLPGVGAAAGAAGMTAVVVADSNGPEVQAAYGVGAPAPVVASPELAGRYEIPGTPYVVALDEEGIVRAKGTVNNLEQMEGLAETARRRADEVQRGAPS